MLILMPSVDIWMPSVKTLRPRTDQIRGRNPWLESVGLNRYNGVHHSIYDRMCPILRCMKSRQEKCARVYATELMKSGSVM